MDDLVDFEALFQRECYREAIECAAPRMWGNPRAAAVTAISHLRLMELLEADEPFELALAGGDVQALVEYGNWLRACGRLDEAVVQLEGVGPGLSEALQTDARRWLGVCYLQLGRLTEGRALLESAKRGYIQLGDLRAANRVKHNLAAMYDELGDMRRARRLLLEVIAMARSEGQHVLLMTGLSNVIRLRLEAREMDGTELLMAEFESLSSGSENFRMLYRMTQVHWLRVTAGRSRAYTDLLDALIVSARSGEYAEMLIEMSERRTEAHMEAGELTAAMAVLYRLPKNEQGQLPSSARALRAMINRKMGNLGEALSELLALERQLSQERHMSELLRVRMQLAYTLFLSGDVTAAAPMMRRALQDMLSHDPNPQHGRELRDMAELLHYASLQPDLSPYLLPVLDSFESSFGVSPLGPRPLAFKVYVFGQGQALLGSEPLTLNSARTLPVLLFLCLHPGSTRAQVAGALYPELPVDVAGRWVAAALLDLKEASSSALIVQHGPRSALRYTVSPFLDVDCELLRFQQALAAGDLPRALALHRGPLLPEAGLVPWATRQRGLALGGLTDLLSAQLLAARAGGDGARAALLLSELRRWEQGGLPGDTAAPARVLTGSLSEPRPA